MICLNADRRHAGGAKAFARGAALAVLLTLAACGGSSSGPEASISEQAPMALTPKNSDGAPDGGGVLAAKVKEAELRKAVDRYRITKQRSESPYDFAGVDLNGDGRPEAIVLFTGQDWCQKTGCSLVVFQEEQFGYRPVSHITSARPPIMAGPDVSFGWRDLILKTGGGAAPVRDVRLAFTGKGYPGNALLQPEPAKETLARAQQILAESASFTAVTN